MKKLRHLYIASLLTLTTNISFAGEPAQVLLTKTGEQQWHVTFELTEPVRRIGFKRNPSDARTRRWLPESEVFQVIEISDEEFIQRRDQEPFSRASFTLTPTYISLPKDYAPFSPYSDGGMLIHSGRFFACANHCSESENEWHFRMTLPEDEHIIVSGQVHQKQVSWMDRDSGQKVYAGKQHPIETPSLIAVIDDGLPDPIRQSLETHVPALMNYFATRLGELTLSQKPTLFASYANVQGGSTQGGVLPGQIFMHWNVNDLGAKGAGDDFAPGILWFFAHEVAHLYQASKDGQVFGEPDHAWIHEGHAELLAAQGLEALFPESKDYIRERFQDAKEQCVAGLKEQKMSDASRRGQFGLHYTCGLLLHDAIDQQAMQQGSNATDVWQSLRDQVEVGEPVTAGLFWHVLQQRIPSQVVAHFRRFIESRSDEPEASLDQLYPQSK
jgi:hypothetical protein